MEQTVTIGEQNVFPESESLKLSATSTPQVENPSDSDSSTPTPQPWVEVTNNNNKSNKSFSGNLHFFHPCSQPAQKISQGRDIFFNSNGFCPLQQCFAVRHLMASDLYPGTVFLFAETFSVNFVICLSCIKTYQNSAF